MKLFAPQIIYIGLSVIALFPIKSREISRESKITASILSFLIMLGLYFWAGMFSELGYRQLLAIASLLLMTIHSVESDSNETSYTLLSGKLSRLIVNFGFLSWVGFF